MKLAVKAYLGFKIVLYTSFKRAVQSSDFEIKRFLLNFVLQNSDLIFIMEKNSENSCEKNRRMKATLDIQIHGMTS